MHVFIPDVQKMVFITKNQSINARKPLQKEERNGKMKQWTIGFSTGIVAILPFFYAALTKFDVAEKICNNDLLLGVSIAWFFVVYWISCYFFTTK